MYHNLEIRLGVQLTFNARLSLGSVAESVEVNDPTPPTDMASSQTATQINADTFEALARGRSFHTVLLMAPGVRHEAKAGAGGVGGISVDRRQRIGKQLLHRWCRCHGCDDRRLAPQNSIPLEFVKELQVKSGGFEAEYGGATGGVVNVSTRGGSNEFHGQVQMEATASNWNASDRGFYQRSASDPMKAEFLRPREDSYRVLYPGGSFGGPILRDRMFAYANYMPELETTDRTIDHEVDGRRVYHFDKVRHYLLWAGWIILRLRACNSRVHGFGLLSARKDTSRSAIHDCAQWRMIRIRSSSMFRLRRQASRRAIASIAGPSSRLAMAINI